MNNLKATAALLLLILIAGLLAVLVYQNGLKPATSQPARPVIAEEPVAGPLPVQSMPNAPEPESHVGAPVQRATESTPLPAQVPVAVMPSAAADLVPLVLNLPTRGFPGTPKDLTLSSYVEPLSDKPRAPLMVPYGLTNVAPQAILTSSDKNQRPQILAKIVDGDKEPADDSILFLRKGLQWVQLDLGEELELFAIVLWHAHDKPKVYHDVIVLTGADPEFTGLAHTLYNNDQDNTSGLGAGTDKEYFETHEGRLINPRGAKARHLRFYSRGSTESVLNEYTEIEVYARKPAWQGTAAQSH